MSLSHSELFIEQAEYLSEDSFRDWSTPIHGEATIMKKLSSSGAKLISGPRGSGKTTLLLKVYNDLSKEGSKSLPVYVNFKSSLKLEPLYRTNTNAAHWFNQWLLYKVLQGLNDTVRDLEIPVDYKLSLGRADDIVSHLELGNIDEIKDFTVTANYVESTINDILTGTKNNKCVLLMDDAGHAFSTEQQQDFFEFFREIKSKTISPKAAVYPGVTSYSTSFHIGHDAEEIDVWVKPNSEGYVDFMHSVLKTRLGPDVFKSIAANLHHLNILCFAAYGIPRALLNMISELQSDVDDFTTIKIDAKSVQQVVKSNLVKTYQIFDTLRIKLPMYESFIEKGSDIFEKCLTINKEFNKGQPVNRQSSIIGIKRPISAETIKVFGFFQYAGLVSYSGISNRGGKGVYELYELHYSAIIDRNVFFSSRGINMVDYAMAFQNRPNHHYPRHLESGIVDRSGDEGEFKLALPSCTNCNTPRLSEESKFCSNCGVKLKDASIFESIVSQDIHILPITESRAKSIVDGSKIKTIKDILMDSDNRQLFQVRMIGPFWAKKIKAYAEEFIA